MTINVSAINTSKINGEDSLFLSSAGQIISIEQDAQLEYTGSGLIVSIAQNTQVTTSNLIISFTQMVRDPAAPDYMTRNGFKPLITIDGWKVPDNRIRGVHTINREENNSAILTFALLPPVGVTDFSSYQGKTVTYDIQRTSGVTRIYTGVINIPTVDLINRQVVITCTDMREEQINAQLGAFKQYIGVFDEASQGKNNSVYDEVTKRLTTVPYSLDFNAYGQYTYTPWIAKGSADFIWGNSTIYRRNPSVKYSSRLRAINQVNITLDYRYPKLHLATIAYNWTFPYGTTTTPGTFLRDAHTQASRAMIEAAISSAGLPVNGSVGYTDSLRSGWYSDGAGGTIGWSNIQQASSTIPLTKPNPVAGGTAIPVLDAAGKQVTENVVTAQTDFSKTFCFGAAWNVSRKWAQTVVERFTISVSAPQSQALYGVITDTMSGAVDSTYDTNLWENNDLRLSSTTSQFTTGEPNKIDFINSSVVLISQARKKILEAHRDTYVTFEVNGVEQIDLVHTVQLTATKLACKGKVRKLTHTINVDEGEFTTEVELAISKSAGSYSASSITPPTRPTDSETASFQSIQLGSHYGVDPTTAVAAKWNGMIGNKVAETTLVGGYKVRKMTAYPVSFIVDVPAVPEQYRKEKVLTATQNYYVDVPVDSLTITLD